MQVMPGLERLAEESNDANVVRGAYKLMRQIEEFVQQLPAKGTEAEPRQRTVRKKNQAGRKKWHEAPEELMRSRKKELMP